MLLFDLDGTLLDSNGIWLYIDVEYLGRQGISPVPEDYTQYVTHHSPLQAARYTRERFGLNRTPEEILGDWLEMGREAYGRTLPLKSGAGELLEKCARAGYGMALVTSCIPELCALALAHHGLTDRLRQVFYAQEMGLEKNDPAFYRAVAGTLGCAPEDCVFFEDTPGYCAAAKAAGVYVVGVDDPLFRGREEEVRRASHLWLESFTRLPEELLARLR